MHFPTIRPAGRAASPVPRRSSRTLFYRVSWLYLLASTVAAAVTLMLVIVGGEFTLGQWLIWGPMIPIGMTIYTTLDIIFIHYQLRPISRALDLLDDYGLPDREVLSNGIVQALNLPLLAFLRVTLFHGPIAMVLLVIAFFVSNLVFDAGFEWWQIGAFCATVIFFASPTHAIFEYFSVGREIEPVIRRLSQRLGEQLAPDKQARLISIRLREKLLYLAIGVASLPLIFFAASIVFKVQRIVSPGDFNFGGESMVPLLAWIGTVITVCIAGAFAMGLLTAQDVSRSAKRMLEAMEKVESGKLDDAQLEVISTDEYADLFRGFSLMVDSLRDEQRILSISSDLAGELQLEVLIERIMEVTAELLNAERSTLFVHDPKTDELVSIYAGGIETREIRIPCTQGIAGAVFTSGMAENIADPYADPRFSQKIDKDTGFVTRSILCAPIVNKSGGRIGVAQVLNKRDGGFTAKDEARLRAFAAQVAVSLENARLFEDVLNIKNYNESILQSISNGIMSLDSENNIVTVNDPLVKIIGMPREQFIGLKFDDLLSTPNRWILQNLRETVATGQPSIAVGVDLTRRDGTVSTVNLTAAPLIDGAGKRIGSLLVVEDITEEKRVRSTMARYMSAEVADELLAAGEAELSGKDQTVSVLFSDVRGFTKMAETLGARETVSVLNAYFTDMVDVIFDHHGILDKYIGDAIMALFGAPFPKPEDPDNALAAANDMLRKLREFNVRQRGAGLQELEIGVGLSTGDVVVGNIGSVKRMEYTVIGDAVNLASRLESANKFYGTRILLSDFTVAALKAPALLREVDLLRVKGKDRPVAVFEAVGWRAGENYARLAAILELHDEGLHAYSARDWAKAEAAFGKLLAIDPKDGPARIYRDRVRLYAKKPPPDDWDGVWVMAEK
ncbi:MAG: adenylate/guanylate cyclase domain-containing protein [Novosphingobium sp.]|nr:adenylate/guanylate cyclase domain-containing protein [Novosphingobium sp.]